MNGIRALIREQGSKPGWVLPSETALAERLGVSRPVAREALRGLATLGIVEIGNGRRARVVEPGASPLAMVMDHAIHSGGMSIQQILDVRRTLELRSAGLAALRRTEAEATRLGDLVAGMEDALETDQSLIMELDIAFHETIAGASRNALYALMIGSFRVVTMQTWPVGWRARQDDANRRANVACHRDIARAIAERDDDAAETAMSAHFDSASATLLKAGFT